MTETKQFLRVVSVYAPKNKLCRLIIEELKDMHGKLANSQGDAMALIVEKYKEVCNEYQASGGRAEIPPNRFYQTPDGFGFIVESTIVLNAHNVIKEL